MMVQFLLFAQSLLIGLSIAAPVGPIGLLTIQRSLRLGARAGLATGLGAAAADAVYGAIGAFGVAGLINTLTALRLPLALVGGAYLLWLAFGLVRTQREPVAASSVGTRAADWRYFSGTFVLTLANPATIYSFIAIFASLVGASEVVSPWTMVAGVFIGSALWWLLLSTLVACLRESFDARWCRRVDLGSAAVLAGFTVWQLVLALTLGVRA